MAEDRRKLAPASQPTDCIKVVVRIRPPSARELGEFEVEQFGELGLQAVVLRNPPHPFPYPLPHQSSWPAGQQLCLEQSGPNSVRLRNESPQPGAYTFDTVLGPEVGGKG